MPTLDHPRIPNVHVTVDGDDIDRWKSAGWVDPTPNVADEPPNEDDTGDVAVEPVELD